MKKIKVRLLCLLAFAAASCGGQNFSAPTVSISTPTNGQVLPASFDFTGNYADESASGNITVYLSSVSGLSTNSVGAVKNDGLFSGSMAAADGDYFIWAEILTTDHLSARSSLSLVSVSSSSGGSTNTTNQATNVITPDTNAPSLVVVSPTNNQSVGSSYTVSGTVSDSESGVLGVYVSTDGGAFSAATLGGGSFSSEVVLSASGSHTHLIYAMDLSNNSTLTQSLVVQYVPGLPSILIDESFSGLLTNTKSLSVFGSSSISEGSISLVQVSLNSGSFTAASGTTSWSSALTLNEGTNTLVARAISSEGVSNESAAVTVVADTTAPSIFISTPSQTIYEGEAIIVSGGASDETSGVSNVSVEMDSTLYSVIGLESWSATLYPSLGTNVITATAVDALGNESSESITVIVESYPEDSFIVYCKKPSSWGGVRIHYWEVAAGDNGGSTTWPGEAMTLLSNDWYYFEFDEGVTQSSLLFNNSANDSDKTADFQGKTGGWYWTNSTWYDECPEGPSVPSLSASRGSGNFSSESVSVTLNVSGQNVARYTTNGSDPSGGTSFSDGKVLTLGASLSIGQSVTLRLWATNSEGAVSESYTYTKTETPDTEVVTNFNQLRIYQVYVSTFQDGDGSIGYWSGYGPGSFGGDLQGIINALDHITNLGMNALWMTPIFDSAADGGDQLSSTGYFCYNYFDVDPRFGTTNLFKTLVAEAHERGLYVILDGVFGHHKYGSVAASPGGLYPSGGNDPVDYPGSLAFYQEVASYWISEFKIDGWRLDQAYQVPVGYWDDIRSSVESACAANEAAGEEWGTLGYMVGEIWKGEGDIQSMGYGSEGSPALYSCFDFPMRYRAVAAFAGAEEGDNDMTYDWKDNSATALDGGYGTHSAYASHAQPNLMIGNHDLARFGDLVQYRFGYTGENSDYWKRHKMAVSLQAAYTGPITIYYGFEIGAQVNNDTSYYNDCCSRAMFDIYTSDSSAIDLQDYINEVMEIRRAHPALWGGSRVNLISSSTIHADLKTSGSDSVVYIVNVSTSDEEVSLNSVGGNGLLDLQSGATISGSGSYSVTVPALSARFLEVQ